MAGEPTDHSSVLEKSSEMVTGGEDGDHSEMETEDGEAGDDSCSSVTECLGKLEVGLITFSFEPGKQGVEHEIICELKI